MEVPAAAEAELLGVGLAAEAAGVQEDGPSYPAAVEAAVGYLDQVSAAAEGRHRPKPLALDQEAVVARFR